MRISDLMDAIEDDTVVLPETDADASARIMEATMKKIHTIEGNKTMPAKRLGRGALAAIIAAAILALSGAALAAGHMFQLVNWKGEPVGEPEPMATPHLETAIAAEDESSQAAARIVESQKSGELVIIRHADGSAESAERREELGSLEELRERLAAEDSVLTVPFHIPANWSFSQGWLTLESAAGYGYTLVSAEETDYDFTAERWAAAEGGDFIAGYLVVFHDADGEERAIEARLQWPENEHAFGTEDGDRAEALTVDGMENALLIERPQSATVYMQKPLDEPIAYESVFHLMNPESVPITEAFTTAFYRLNGWNADADELTVLIAP